MTINPTARRQSSSSCIVWGDGPKPHPEAVRRGSLWLLHPRGGRVYEVSPRPGESFRVFEWEKAGPCLVQVLDHGSTERHALVAIED